ncbi:hypothetical protein KIN20_032567 [Parelaphostrongylus tenuis]|nr:hypothetical protein KIN20_032567 [Parelaphostrongylus tenuis]
MLESYELSDSDDEKESNLFLHYSLALNIFSIIGNLVASILSGSLSIMSTFVDSSMDLLCSAVMNVCLRLIGQADSFNYPRGKERLESIGVLICAILMAFANIGMAMEALNDIADDTRKPVVTSTTTGIIAVQTVLKGLLSWVCYQKGTPSSIVVAMDLRNDVATRVSAVVFAYVGDHYWRLADPIGSIIICTTIAISWFCHVLENIPPLVGHRVEQEQLSRIMKVVIDHDPRIRCLDHLMVYHMGAKAFVELHIVMDERLPLKVTHDVSHSLEKKLQRLEFVERAFVHCDYTCDGD